jgi:hypothetical protein
MTILYLANVKKRRIEKVQRTVHIYRKIVVIYPRCSAPSYYWMMKFGGTRIIMMDISTPIPYLSP